MNWVNGLKNESHLAWSVKAFQCWILGYVFPSYRHDLFMTLS